MSAPVACPRCGETNIPGKLAMIEAQKNGIHFCSICGKTFVPEKENA